MPHLTNRNSGGFCIAHGRVRPAFQTRSDSQRDLHEPPRFLIERAGIVTLIA